ncbi:DNA primase [Corynebacterium ulceribovis]|uniref:DNA primase n=1 Tax=Corynebacterium ulceribovis TaxID=487732 RepID=UPI0003725117|nr:DNA primase [Corynebacterium ulceribovis]
MNAAPQRKGRIPDSDIAAIRDRTAIEEIVAEYVQLKPGGADSLKGLSPFKDERTPSFHVRPNHGYYHCFSTGKGGDVFNFLMEMEHLSFPEAVEACADRIGYRINYEGGGPVRQEAGGNRQRLLAANREAQRFYATQLKSDEAETARKFLQDRGFSGEQAQEFGCGYAPDGWDTLTVHLIRLGFDFKELEAAGLSKMGRRGPIDRFHRRLLWPIRNLAGDVIGFGARKLYDDDNLGKYMNTPETMLYKKSKVLFGLDLAKKQIAEQHRTVIVEGYTDVMAMHAAGVQTALASCGTAFGDEHLKLIRRLMLDDNYFRGELIYIFDGDEAGQKAALRAFEGDQLFTGQSYVVVMPDGMDPCDLRLERGDAAVRDMLERRVPMFEFVVKHVLADYDLATPDGRIQALRRTVPIVAGIRDRSLRDEYARQLAGWAGWPDTVEVVQRVRQEAKRGPRKAPELKRRKELVDDNQLGGASASGGAVIAMPRPNPKDPHLWVQRESLKLVLQEPAATASYFDQLPTDVFGAPVYRQLAEAVLAVGGGAGGASLGSVAYLEAVSAQVGDPMLSSLVSELAVEPLYVAQDVENLEPYAGSVLARLQESWVSEQITQLKARLQRMRPDDDPEQYNQVFADLMALEQYRRILLQRAKGEG